jgi:hypothetical protein
MGFSFVSGLVHAKRGTIDVKDGFFLGDFVGLALAQRDDFLHHLGVIAATLGFGEQVADVALQGLLLTDQLFRALNELAQFVSRHAIVSGHRVHCGHPPNLAAK